MEIVVALGLVLIILPIVLTELALGVVTLLGGLSTVALFMGVVLNVPFIMGLSFFGLSGASLVFACLGVTVAALLLSIPLAIITSVLSSVLGALANSTNEMGKMEEALNTAEKSDSPARLASLLEVDKPNAEAANEAEVEKAAQFKSILSSQADSKVIDSNDISEVASPAAAASA